MTPISPELALLAACGLAPDDELGRRAAQAAAQRIDWERFERLAFHHGIAGLCGGRLAAAAPGTLPPALAERLLVRLRQDTVRQLSQTAESVRLQDLLTRAGIPVLVLKGAALAHMLYAPHPEWRISSDIDLLIGESDLLAADALLRGDGLVRTDPPDLPRGPGWEMHRLLVNAFDYLRPEAGLLVELHYRLSANPHCNPASFAALQAQAAEVQTRFGPLRGPDGAAFCAYLGWHALAHTNFRLRWLFDLARAVRRLGAASLTELLAQAGESSALRPAALCDSVLAVLRGGQADPAWQRETYRIAADIEAGNSTAKARTIARLPVELAKLRFMLRLSSGWKARAHFLLHTLCDPRDATTLGLGRRFLPVYAVAGPLLSLGRLLRRSARRPGNSQD